MTNELIAEARKFLATPNLGRDMAREPNRAILYIRELADIAEAAEARVKELEAGVEWEYGLRTQSKSDPVRGFFSYAGDLETAWEMYGATYEYCTATIVRRRKAGPWVPIESEGE